MIPRRRLLQLCPVVAGAGLAGCRSAPPTLYFRLSTLDGTPLRIQPETVQIRNIGIPEYLDQTGIAEPSAQYQFAASDIDLWAEPLAQMLQAVLVQNLAQRLPDATVTASSGMIGAPPDLRVEINVLRFDPDASGRMLLAAQIALKASADDRFLATKTVQSDAAPGGADMAGTMAAMSTLWAGLADELARLIAQNQV